MILRTNTMKNNPNSITKNDNFLNLLLNNKKKTPIKKEIAHRI